MMMEIVWPYDHADQLGNNRPDLDDLAHHVEDEDEMVLLPDTVVHPRTVMVECGYASFAIFAVTHTKRLFMMTG